MTNADDIITALNLKAHPEGGHYAETFRDTQVSGGRAASSAIYYLLKAGERSHWHRVDAAEVWHYYAGAPLKLSMSDGVTTNEVILGGDILAGQRPQGVVPRGVWQSAEIVAGTGHDWVLVGCTVAPAFEFAGFEMAVPEWEPHGSPKPKGF